MKRILSLITALTILAVITIMPAIAEGRTYTPVTGSQINIEKCLIMDKTANVPNIEFSYAITAGTAKQAQGSNIEIYAGNDTNKVTGTPTIGTASFSVGQTTYETTQDVENTNIQNKTNGSTLNKDNITLESNEKYARSKININFTSVSFKEPGVYRYIITENASDNPAITMDSDSTRTLDVYVEADGESALRIAGYVLHNGDNTDIPEEYATGEPSTKANGFVNRYNTKAIQIAKVVTGNQASHDEYFEFTLQISDAVANTVYTVDLTNADPTTKTNAINTEAKTNPSTITVGNDGTVTTKFYLQGGQNVTINGLGYNTKYSISEDKTTMTNEGYKATSITVVTDADATV